ncbi:MAG: hypothetical protein D6706_07100 [Chloroflexi bacterium]|nr:MAG: hypothetical protein D6706_07100 [Chloroflexota bacterium]
MLRRFALIFGDTKVFDTSEQVVIKKTAFQDLVGKDIAKAWMAHPARRTVMPDDVAHLQSSGNKGSQAAILQRYVYLYPTKDVWDTVDRCIIPLDALKAAIPADFDWWMKNPKRRQIKRENLVFDPTQQADPKTHINMFRGLPLKPARTSESADGIIALVDHLCNGDDDIIDWMLKWLALPLQRVGAKLDTALLVHSTIQGTGKSMLFADLHCQLYGEYGAVLGQHQLESQYTDWRSQKLYGVFEEIFSREQKYSHTGTLKHMITGKTQRIEKKFVSGWEEANHMNAVFLSNEIQPFPVEPSDRRMMVIWPERTLPEEIQNRAGYEIESGVGAPAWLRFLLDYPLGDFNEHTKPPMTEAKERLIRYGMPAWETFFLEWRDGNLEIPFCSCRSNDLYKAYTHYCRTRNEHYVSQTKFSTIMATKIRKKADAKYHKSGAITKATAFIIGEPPEGQSERAWLTEQFAKFQNGLNQMLEG